MKPSRLQPLQTVFSEHRQQASPQRAMPSSRFIAFTSRADQQPLRPLL